MLLYADNRYTVKCLTGGAVTSAVYMCGAAEESRLLFPVGLSVALCLCMSILIILFIRFHRHRQKMTNDDTIMSTVL